MDSCTASTICPNPSEGVYKYTVVTSGRPVVDGLHHGDLPVPADFLRKQGVAEARMGKRQPGKLSATGVLPPVKARDLKVHSFKKPSIQPLDPTEMSDYSPRTTTFVNGRPSSVSTPKHHNAFAPASAVAGPSHPSPDSVRDGSPSARDDLEDAASVDSAPGSMRLLNPRSRDVASSLPDSLANPRFPFNRFPQDLSTTDESLDLYLEQFFPELHSMSDAELLRLMDPNPSTAPALPTRASTLAILQDMLMTQGSYASSASLPPTTLKQHPSTASNPPSSNWSSMASDEHHSHNWSDAPSHSWRSPRSPSPGPANWMSWPSTTQARKRQRSLDGTDELEWPTLAEHMPALSGEVAPPSKRQMLQRPLPTQQQQAGDHEAVSSLDRQLLFGVSSAGQAGHEPRPNPFASVCKTSLMQPAHGLPRGHGLELPSYLSMQSSVSLTGPAQRGLGCSPPLASPGADSSSRGSSLDNMEPASALEQALRDLRSKPEAQAC